MGAPRRRSDTRRQVGRAGRGFPAGTNGKSLPAGANGPEQSRRAT
ncbi:hypothetical protein GCM10010430_47580 [Kitasatospora cystarginea]|uniref:Uncharacterized protein n=1 Tax=Kitasatospora cystarginea TaxID=58350 RepID=A0ABP5RCX1_9ACTN